MDWLHELFETVVNSFASEGLLVGFAFGVLIFLVGLSMFCGFLFSRLSGSRTAGTVIGAIEVTRIRIKTRKGESFRKIKKSLFPVYEYRDSRGALKQTASSHGGTFTKRYVTGQAVNLIVREDEDGDVVSDADVRVLLYLGLGFLSFGGVLMALMGSSAASLGIGVVSLLIALLLRGAAALVSGRSDKKKGGKLIDTSRRASIDRSFTPEDVKPIEHFH